MSGDTASMFELGRSYKGTLPGGSATDYKHSDLLGETMLFDCLNYAAASKGIRDKRSGSKIRAVLLRNQTGGTVTGGLWYSLKADGAGAINHHAVGALATSKAGFPYILADPFLTDTVANGDLFLGIVSGIVPVTTAAAITINTLILPSTGGKSATHGAGDEFYACGRILETALSGDLSKLAKIYNLVYQE